MIDPTTQRAERAGRLRRLIRGSHEAAPTPPSWPSPLAAFALAQWAGLVTGMLELLVLFLRNYFQGTAVLGELQLNRHFPWMVPAAHLAIFSAVGLLIAPLALVRKKWAWMLSGGILGTLAGFALLGMIPGLHWAACLVLGAGLSTRIVAQVARRANGFRTLVRRSYLPLMAALIAVFGVRYSQVAMAERWAMAALAKPPAKAPNVLLVVMDTVRADHLSLYGYGRDTTPNLAALASKGITFDQARSTAPWTLPSHASLFTGRYQHELRVFLNRPLDARYPTIAEYLRDRGYQTAGFVANTRFCNSWYGLGRGFIHYEDYFRGGLDVSPSETLRSAELGRRLIQIANPQRNVRPGETNVRKSAERVTSDFLDWHASAPDRPFFAFLNYYDAHDPYVTPGDATRHFGTRPENRAELDMLQSPHINQKLAEGKCSPREVALVMDGYDDCIAYLDGQLGRLFAELERRGTLKDTLVIVTSDHGEHLGEHKIYGHGQSLYRAEIHVPLLIVPPAGTGPAGLRVKEPVSLRDVAATVAEGAGLAEGAPFPGRSLASLYYGQGTSEGSPRPGDPVLSELIRGGKSVKKILWPPALRGPMQAIVADGQTYIRNGDGQEELYDLEADPGEVRDLAGSDAGKARLPRFRKDAERAVKASKDEAE